MTENRPKPVDIVLHQKSRKLEIAFDDGARYVMSCEYLRVMSPSAEVQGHGPGQAVLQIGKENVNIQGIEPVGNYAVKLRFDDGHDSGLYSWDLLYALGRDQTEKFQEYLDKLAAAGHQRAAGADAVSTDASQPGALGKVVRI